MRWWQMRKRDADLTRELQSDLELEEEEQRERGLPPEEARRAALTDRTRHEIGHVRAGGEHHAERDGAEGDEVGEVGHT